MKPPQMSQSLLDTGHSREDLVSLGIQGLKCKPSACSSGVCAYCHLYACPSVCDISFPLLDSKAFLFITGFEYICYSDTMGFHSLLLRVRVPVVYETFQTCFVLFGFGF